MSLGFMALLFVVSCSKVQEIDKRTQSMERSTSDVSTTTESMKETTTIMYQQIRSKEAEDTRDEKFQILMSEEAGMGTRITAAGVYFKSMEFQLWNNNETYDNKEVIEDYYLDAANELTRRLTDLYEKINVKKMSPTKDNKMEMSFYALAAAMHMNHTFQDELAKSKNSEVVSMYDLIKKALIKERDHRILLSHEEVLMSGINKEIMINLIKARIDIYSALALKNLTDKRDMTLGQKAKGLIFKITGGRLGSIDLPEVFDKSNDATKIHIEKYLDGALKAKTFLKDIGIEKKLEKTLFSAFKEINLTEKSIDSSDERRIKIQSQIDQLLK
jgi:hypothetical protein